jgi:hypothetical protein
VGKEDGRELLDFVEGEMESKFLVHIIPNRFQEKFWLLVCAFVVSEI